MSNDPSNLQFYVFTAKKETQNCTRTQKICVETPLQNNKHKRYNFYSQNLQVLSCLSPACVYSVQWVQKAADRRSMLKPKTGAKGPKMRAEGLRHQTECPMQSDNMYHSLTSITILKRPRSKGTSPFYYPHMRVADLRLQGPCNRSTEAHRTAVLEGSGPKEATKGNLAKRGSG